MKGEKDEKSLSELTILGTHNACALYGGNYAACQSIGLVEQLKLGVRFLDIRCQWKNNDLNIVHGFVDQKMKFSEVVKICGDFLKNNPSETIMMSVMEQSSKSRQKGDFGKKFRELMDEGLRDRYEDASIPKLGDVRGMVVVVSRNNEVKGLPWRAFQIQDAFKIGRGNSIEDKWSKITKHFERAEKSNKPHINFVSCTGIFYPPNSTAKILNPKLINYLRENREKKLGIILVDFVSGEIAKELVPAE